MNALPSIRLRFTRLFVLGLATLVLLIQSPGPDSRAPGSGASLLRQCQRACQLLLAGRLLLAGDGATRSLAGTCVGLGCLATDGQATAMAQATIAADVHEALDVQLNFTPQVTFDLVLLLHHATQAGDLRFSQVLDPGVRADLSLDQDLPGPVDA